MFFIERTPRPKRKGQDYSKGPAVEDLSTSRKSPRNFSTAKETSILELPLEFGLHRKPNPQRKLLSFGPKIDKFNKDRQSPHCKPIQESDFDGQATERMTTVSSLPWNRGCSTKSFPKPGSHSFPKGIKSNVYDDCSIADEENEQLMNEFYASQFPRRLAQITSINKVQNCPTEDSTHLAKYNTSGRTRFAEN